MSSSRILILRQWALAFSDMVMIACAFLAAYGVRFYLQIVPLRHEIPPYSWYIKPLGLVLLIYFLSFRAVGLYAIRYVKLRVESYAMILHGIILSGILLISLLFFYRDVSYSRVVTLFACGILAPMMVIVGRIFVRRVVFCIGPFRQDSPRLLVIGEPNHVERLTRFLKHADGYKDIKTLGASYLQDLTRLKNETTQWQPNVLILAEPDIPRSQIAQLILQCEQQMIQFRMVPDMVGLLTTSVGIQDIEGLPLVGLRETPLMDPWNRFKKRALDLTVATLALGLTLPFWGFIAWMIKQDSPGPVFYIQKRVGQDGKNFNMLKFRTMKLGAETQTGPVWTQPNDDRRTRFGIFLRRWNLDELPQLINVLRGDMSLVGPRPERPHFVRQFKEDIPRYMTRHKIRSGMTGWAQIHGLRGDTSIDERTQYDLYYLENWSLWLDCKILAKSLGAVKNAY